MKLRVATWRILWRYLIAVAIVFLAVIGVFFNAFFNFDMATSTFSVVPFGWSQITILSVTGGIAIAFFIPTVLSYYYIIDKKFFIMKKYGKTYEFDYANIQFIDIEESKRKKMVIFYAPTCKTKYLLGDKNGVLLENLIKKCPNTMSVQEFRAKHPEEKY